MRYFCNKVSLFLFHLFELIHARYDNVFYLHGIENEQACSYLQNDKERNLRY